MNWFKKKEEETTKIKPESEDFGYLKVVLENISDGVIVIDEMMRIIEASQISETWLGLKKGEMIGLTIDTVLKTSENDLEIMAALKSANKWEKEVELISYNKKTSRVKIEIYRIVRYAVIILKKIEDNAKLLEFVSTASHEMRTPVASIQGYLSLAINPKTATIDERARKYLTAANLSSQHLGKLFLDLLDTTKLEVGNTKLRSVAIDLKEKIKEIGVLQLPLFNEAKISFSLDQEELGQLVYVFADESYLKEAVDNLLENAKKWTKPGGEVELKVLGQDNMAIIRVKDSGAGIGPEDLPHIFQKFYRADNSDTREIGGTGLGLYLVKEKIEKMGGKVWVESELGRGSTFYIGLPRISEAEFRKIKLAEQNQSKMQTSGV